MWEEWQRPKISPGTDTETHRTTTGPEILRQINGEIDAFAMGVGTGGTVMGVGRALQAGSRARIVAVEPDESAVLSGDEPGPHGIQGLADGFIPSLVNRAERYLSRVEDPPH